MITLDKHDNPLPGVNLHTVVVPSVYRIREFPAPADNDNNPFFIFEIYKREGVTLDRLAGLRSTEREAIIYALEGVKFSSSKFYIITALTLTEAQNLLDLARARFAL